MIHVNMVPGDKIQIDADENSMLIECQEMKNGTGALMVNITPGAKKNREE